MTDNITLFSQSDADVANISNAISGIDDAVLTTKLCSLTVANGTAHALAKSGEIVLFRTDPEDESEAVAVREFVNASTGVSKIVAICDPDTPLSQVRKLMDAGVADVLPAPVGADDLKRSIAAMRQVETQTSLTKTTRGRVITVAQSRGGIGATTLAVNLADSLQGTKRARKKGLGKRVAIVDLDLQFGGIASFLDVDPKDGLLHMVTEGITPDATFLSQALVESRGGLSVLTAPTDFVPLDALSRHQVDALIEQLKMNFDYVVIDLPRTLVSWVQAVLNGSDQLLLVTDSTVPSIRQSKRLIGAYTEENPTLPIEMVINHEAKPLIKGRHHVQAAKLLERDLAYWLPPDPKPAREALDRGVPLSEVAGRARLTKAIAKISHKIQAKPISQTDKPQSDGQAPVATFATKNAKGVSDRV